MPLWFNNLTKVEDRERSSLLSLKMLHESQEINLWCPSDRWRRLCHPSPFLIWAYYALFCPVMFLGGLYLTCNLNLLAKLYNEFLALSFCTKSNGQRSFSNQAPTFWNHLPVSSCQAPSLNSYKPSLKTCLFLCPFFTTMPPDIYLCVCVGACVCMSVSVCACVYDV